MQNDVKFILYQHIFGAENVKKNNSEKNENTIVKKMK